MSKVTTEDCKLFLLDLYKDKKVTEWKRIRKFKDENGDSCRDFSHSDGTYLTLIEKMVNYPFCHQQKYKVLLKVKTIRNFHQKCKIKGCFNLAINA